MTGRVPPRRPSLAEERVASLLFVALAPRRATRPLEPTPAGLQPFDELRLARTVGDGTLAAVRFAATGAARGGVLLLHPWLAWGRTYFHRRGRIEALREAGYEVLVPDFPGFGSSGPPRLFFDRGVEDALAAFAALLPGRPLHVWGVSSGGYWAHPVTSRGGFAGAFFEDVSPHLHEWSWRQMPWGRPFYLLFRFALPRAYRFLDMRLHAAVRAARAATYVSGALDRGVQPADTRALAEASGGEAVVVEGAGHLDAIRVDGQRLLALALATFERANR